MAMAGLAQIPCRPVDPLRRLPRLPSSSRPSYPALPLSGSSSPSAALRLRRSCRRLAAASPPPEEPGDPSGGEFDPVAGLEAKINRAKDGAQIFFAVLFWMSLFFWASVWDDKDNNRPKKGGWFKR